MSISATVGHRTDTVLWHTGLLAAGMLRRDFPAFWATHVAHLPVSRDRLLAAGAALIRLISATVQFNDWFIDRVGEFGDGSPLDAINHPAPEDLMSGDGEDTYDLLRNFILEPPLEVYGLDLNADDGYEFGQEHLAHALQWITMLEAYDYDQAVLAVGDTFAEELIDLPRVDCRGEGDQLTQLCEALDDAEGLPRYYGGVGLGTLLAYAHQRTDNWLANIGLNEAFDAQGYGAWDVSWEQMTVAEAAALQAQAEVYQQAYAALEQMTAKPIFLLDLSETIARVATAAGLRVVWPGSGDDHDDDDDGQGKTLAAILGETVPA